MVLLMDDDEGFRSALAENLRDDGYHVAEFSGVHDLPPLPTLGEVRAVVTDYDMPGIDGLTFAETFHAQYPDIPIIMVTGYPTPDLEARIESRGFVSLLRKPLDYGELQTLLGQLVAPTRL